MTSCTPTIVAIKNQWLHQQVEVEHPTPESLRGREIYQSLSAAQTVHAFVPDSVVLSENELYLVDFHRLTILFAMMQAKRIRDKSAQAELLEFFAQIILSKPCELYVGFSDGQPCAAAMLTEHDQEWLISDCVMLPNSRFARQHDLVNAIVAHKSSYCENPKTVWLETSQE
ncbi:hypothetical protein [Vibrio palustris]|uniref:Flavodoxin n=1 Tax=Vibrio palustris TaxID=1918946 RepID=A0A1R4B6S8_9VIBR|nr:hypothetical protein [Vibrio palustris]SJL84633.1 hypothetical protein VPAL9027_02625 [Vibrio palustris]